MLKGIHILLTYTCIFECDHCFLHCGPTATGTFTLIQISRLLKEAQKIRTVENIYFEGGEPFLFYPVLLEGVRQASDMGFDTGIVTNGYWAKSVDDAVRWLEPLRDLRVSDISISNDTFHYNEKKRTPAENALAAAQKLGIPADSICIDPPNTGNHAELPYGKGEPVIGGVVRFRGRAVAKLTDGLSVRPWEELVQCPYENLTTPERLHVDAFGNAHICQGLSIGNVWQKPLTEIMNEYDPDAHPICGLLIRGGPARLVREYRISHEDAYVDECHLCYATRLALIQRFPEYLTPPQVYGLENSSAHR